MNVIMIYKTTGIKNPVTGQVRGEMLVLYGTEKDRMNQTDLE